MTDSGYEFLSRFHYLYHRADASSVNQTGRSMRDPLDGKKGVDNPQVVLRLYAHKTRKRLYFLFPRSCLLWRTAFDLPTRKSSLLGLFKPAGAFIALAVCPSATNCTELSCNFYSYVAQSRYFRRFSSARYLV